MSSFAGRERDSPVELEEVPALLGTANGGAMARRSGQRLGAKSYPVQQPTRRRDHNYIAARSQDMPTPE